LNAIINIEFVVFCGIFDVLQNFFKKPLKFPQPVPLPVSDTSKSVSGASGEKIENFLKFLLKTLKFLKTLPLPG
jgi:hypothetical protein